MNAFATLSDISGPLLETVVADFLADAAEIPGTPYRDPRVLASFVRSLGGADAEDAAAGLCSGVFRRRWADASAPHHTFLRVPLAAAMLRDDIRAYPGTKAAHFAGARARAEAAGSPVDGWRIPRADGSFDGPRPAGWVRTFSRRGFASAAPDPDAAEFGTDVALAEKVLSDRDFEAWALSRSLADRAWPFPPDEHAALKALAERKSARVVLGRWFEESGENQTSVLADHVVSKLTPQFGPWVEMAVHWVDATEAGTAAVGTFKPGPQDGFPALFGASALAIPKVKALLAKLAKLDAVNHAANAEFHREAGPERSALVRERAESVQIMERQAFAIRLGRAPTGPRPRA